MDSLPPALIFSFSSRVSFLCSFEQFLHLGLRDGLGSGMQHELAFGHYRFSSLQAFGDNIHFFRPPADFHGNHLHRQIFSYDPHILGLRASTDGFGRNQYRLLRNAEFQPDSHKLSGPQALFCVRKQALKHDHAGLGIDGIVHESQVSRLRL
jgi:hypothetical protein